MTSRGDAAARTLRARLRWLVRTPLHPQWLMPARQITGALRNCRGVVLDIGSADRWVHAELHRDARYIALDYPATAIGLYGLRPDVLADAQRLPFADGSVDAVACFEVLEHVLDPDAVMHEIARVLAPGGVVDMSMPFLYPIHDEPYDFQRWTVHGWRRSVADAGLRMERADPANHPLHAGAVLANLAIAGPLQALRGWRRLPALAVAAVLVLVVNIGAWLLAHMWPRWGAMTTTYRVLARKPA